MVCFLLFIIDQSVVCFNEQFVRIEIVRILYIKDVLKGSQFNLNIIIRKYIDALFYF